MFKKTLNIYFIIIIILTFFISFIQFYETTDNVYSEIVIPNFHFSGNSEFSWPIPGFHNITSNFGTRVHPISKKASTHQGIDISASPRHSTLCC